MASGLAPAIAAESSNPPEKVLETVPPEIETKPFRTIEIEPVEGGLNEILKKLE